MCKIDRLCDLAQRHVKMAAKGVPKATVKRLRFRSFFITVVRYYLINSVTVKVVSGATHLGTIINNVAISPFMHTTLVAIRLSETNLKLFS